MLVRRTLLGSALAAPLIAGCAKPASTASDAPEPYPAPVPDPDSFANPQVAKVTHVALDLTADFARKVLSGTATLSIEPSANAHEIILDCDKLNIRSIRTEHGATTFSTGAVKPDHGAPLTVAITPDVRTLTIAYETSPQAGALQWLSAEQTASGKAYLFSQGESILTRSWVPTQDSPQIRQTYEARIVVPADLHVVMSAAQLTTDGEAVANDAGKRAYRFRMEHPIPCYLFALAIGDLQFRATGPRTGVWSEPSVVDAAAREFSDTENMLRATEALYGPYRWGRYDVLVLPPSFPFGGMENPRMTFATPTIIAGDKSLVNVITHEMAHSWSGNLVTNAVWADAWLNEGVTTYIEGRISEALYGRDRAAMAQVLSWAQIQRAIAHLPAAQTQLHGPGAGSDDHSAAIDYDKASLFLRTIEGVIGRPAMDGYLRSYFNRHAFQPMTTARFLADFRAHVVKGDHDLEQRLQLDAWTYQSGLPSNAVEPHAAAFDRVDVAARAFANGGAPDAALWATWGTFERQRYLQSFATTLPTARCDALEAALHLNELGNDEVLSDWLMLAVRSGYEKSAPSVTGFLRGQGRGKYVVPLYRALMAQGPWGRVLARQIYVVARPTYHPIVVSAVDSIVKPG
jgi:aminopeptidase N